MSGGLSRLRAWREAKGWTLQECADLTGYSTAMFSLAERGERVLSPDAKVIISRRLGAKVSDLFNVVDVPGLDYELPLEDGLEEPS